MNLFSQAAQGLNLTPGQRAALKIIKGLIVSAVGAGLAAVAQLLSAGGVIDWQKVIVVGGVAFGTSLAFALDKYWTAQGDTPLAVLAGEVGQMIETKAGPNDTVLPFNAPTPTPAPAPATPPPPAGSFTASTLPVSSANS